MGKREKFFGVFGRKEKAFPSPTPAIADGKPKTLDGECQQDLVRPNGKPGSRSGVATERVHGLPSSTNSVTKDELVQSARIDVLSESLQDPRQPQTVSQAATSPAVGAAYSAAWAKLSTEDQAQLMQDADIKKLFTELEKTNEDHRHDNVLRRGMIAVEPWLRNIQGAIDMSGPFLSLEPTASSAMGLVGGCLSIATAICGAVDGITPQIGAFLERIPVIKRCDEVIKMPSQLQDIHNNLVATYSDLFRFYLLASRMFRESKFMLQMLKNLWNPELSEVMNSFKAHADALSMLLESETFASVQEIKEEQVEALIRNTLDTDRKKEVHYHNQLKQRADSACDWILEDRKFNAWRSTPEPGILMMLGDMGSGKTMMSAFVADALTKIHTTCAYYCKDDGETNRLVSIYRSFLWQLVKRRPNLKPSFRKWYEDAEQIRSTNATQDVEELETFLRKAIINSETWTFIVLDGLDECGFDTRKLMMQLFGGCFEQSAKLKVFVSSRYNAEIDMISLPKQTEKLHFAPSADRDRMLTTYLVSQSAIPDNLSAKVIEVLSVNAQGSAIWLRIALEYLAKCLIRSERGMDRALDQLVASKDLAGMYWKLYDQMFSDLPEFQADAQTALEILAIAQRPLTGIELSVAVHTNREDEQAETIEELQEISTDFDIVGKIRPFVSALKDDEGNDRGLRLVHQSLKELVLKAPPSDWQHTSKTKKGSDERRRLLESEMMKRCMRYMLYDECNEVDIPERFQFYEHEADFEMLGMFGGGIDDEDAKSEVDDYAGATATFEPMEAGLGAFYTYSAVHWHKHFAEIDPKTGAPERDDVIEVCRPGSNRLKNWLEVCCRPNQTVRIEMPQPEPLSLADPVLITASLGCAEMVPQIIGGDLEAPEFFRGTLREAVKRLAKRDATNVLIDLMKIEVTREVLLHEDTFYILSYAWRNTGHEVDKKVLQKRGEVFRFLISETKESVIPEAGNEILCHAAEKGCLPLLEKLFEAASEDPAVKHAILTPNRRTNSVNSFRWLHQSVGSAIWESHEDIAAWLCEQDGIEPHIRFVNSIGATVYHQAARRARVKSFELLVKVWPEGINIRDEDGSTGLDLLKYNWQRGGKEKEVKYIERLLMEHGAEPTGLKS